MARRHMFWPLLRFNIGRSDTRSTARVSDPLECKSQKMRSLYFFAALPRWRMVMLVPQM
jgi:hypothetical protein